MSAAERRIEDREPAGAAIRIKFKTPQDLQEYYLRDISRGGMFIATPRPHTVGEIVSLLVQLPEGDEIKLQARVAHVRLPAQVGPGMPAGMGVEFIAMPAEAADRISACVRQLRTSRPPRTVPRPAAAPTPEEFELIRRLCWVLARGSFADRALEEVLGVPGEAPREARREVFRRLRAALRLDQPPPFLAMEDRWEMERKLRMVETIVDTAAE
jgi:uncharacterized protein (TIGR02266 family)